MKYKSILALSSAVLAGAVFAAGEITVTPSNAVTFDTLPTCNESSGLWYATGTAMNDTALSEGRLHVDTGSDYIEYLATNLDEAGTTKSTVNVDKDTYIDMRVQFTASDEAPSYADGDKLIVWLAGSDYDLDSNPDTDDSGLYVTHGEDDGAGTATVKHTKLDVTVSADTEYRLTVKQSAALTEEGDQSQFSIYIDNNLVASNLLGIHLEGKGDKEYGQLEGVAFQGDGYVDDLAITTDSLEPATSIEFTLVKPTGIADATWTINGTETKSNSVKTGDVIVVTGVADQYYQTPAVVTHTVTAEEFASGNLTIELTAGAAYTDAERVAYDLANPVKGVVTLSADVTLSSVVNLNGGADGLTLDLNGKTINSTVAGVLTVTNGIVTVKNGTIAGPTGSAGAALDSHAMVVVDGMNNENDDTRATLILGDVTITCGGSGSDGMYGVYVLNGGSLIAGIVDEYDASKSLYPSISSHFAAIGANNTTSPTTITIEGGTYTSAASTDTAWWKYFCAAVYAPGNGTLTINGGTFDGGCYSIASRYANVAQTITINGGTFNDPLFVDSKTGMITGSPRVITKDSEVTLDLSSDTVGYTWVANTVTATSYAITYTYVDTDDNTVADVTNGNATEFTVESEAITIDTTKITKDGYTVQSVSPATIAAGTHEAQTVTVTLKKDATPEVTPVAPGSEQKITPTIPEGATEEEAQAAADAEAAKLVVGVPTEVAAELDDDQETAYKSLFTMKATKSEGKWVASPVLTEAAETAIEDEISATAVETSVLSAAQTTDGKATVTTKPGIYYAVEYGTDVGLGKNTAGTMATSTETKLSMPAVSGGKAFFRVKASATPIDAK